MPASVFLSYQSASRSKVEAVRRALEASYIGCWMDKREITAGDDWLKTIRKGLENSQLLILFLTQACEQTHYVIHELLTAESLGLPILVVRLEKYRPVSAPLNRINRFQALDVFDGPIEDALENIVYTVRRMLAGRDDDMPELTGSPVADIGRLVNEAWIKGFLQPTITGLVEKEGHGDGIDRPHTFSGPDGVAIYKPRDRHTLPTLFKRATGKVMIAGERGSGKTILMLQLVRDLIPLPGDVSQSRAPVYLNVGSWVDPQKSAEAQPKILNWVHSRLMKEYNLHSKRAAALIDNNNLIYCFDGLDDILDSHYHALDEDEATVANNMAFQRRLLEAFIRQLGELVSDNAQQVVIAGGPAVQTLVSECRLPFYTLEIKPWSYDDLLSYLNERGIGTLATFIDAHKEIAERLIKNFSELQMLGTIYQEKVAGEGLEDRAKPGMEEFFSYVYDTYLDVKYKRFLNDVRGGNISASGSDSKNKTARITKAGALPVGLKEIRRYAPSIASYISRPGQGGVFRLDTLQPDELPRGLYSIYRWYAGLTIGSGIALTAGVPVFTCIILEALAHHAPARVLGLHLGVAVLGYLLAALITAAGYCVTGGWVFGLVIGLAFAIDKGFASGCSLRSPGFPPGWEAGIHNGLIALVGGSPIFAAIMWQIREEPYKILPIETWDPDTGKLVYWVLGAAGLGLLFALGLGWAKGLSFALALGIFAYERFGKKPRLAPVHVRPNQAIIYSFQNAVRSAATFALLVGGATGISYTLAYGLPEGPLSGIMAMSAFVSVFFFGGLPVAKHIALRKTLRYAHLVSGKLGLWLQMAVNVGLMKQVGGGYVFSSDDARREYESRQKSAGPFSKGWGGHPSHQDIATTSSAGS